MLGLAGFAFPGGGYTCAGSVVDDEQPTSVGLVARDLDRAARQRDLAFVTEAVVGAHQSDVAIDADEIDLGFVEYHK